MPLPMRISHAALISLGAALFLTLPRLASAQTSAEAYYDFLIARHLEAAGDAKGAQAALEKGVYLLKPNLSELCSLVGKEYLEMSEIEDAALDIIRSGKCEVLVVSMGPSGAMLVTKNEVKQYRAPVVKKLSTVGAGDSMVAGIVWKIEQGFPLTEAVRFGIACGTAATASAPTATLSTG